MVLGIEPDSEGARPRGLDAMSAGEFLRASPDPTITVARDGTVRTTNPAVKPVLGYAPGALVGEPVARLLPDRFFEPAADVASDYLETGTSPVGTRSLEVFARHADGHEVPLSVTVVEHQGAGERVVTLVGREITERIDRDAALTRERDRFAAALDALAAAPDPATHALDDLVTRAWGRVNAGPETLSVDLDRTVRVDRPRAEALFTALLAATAPRDGVVAVDDGAGATDEGSEGVDVRIGGSAVATDPGAAPALVRAMAVSVERDHTSISVSF